MRRLREFTLPDVGEGLTEAEIVRWFVAPDDPVRDGMAVCEIETAKALVELPIPFDGKVHALHFERGATVDVGAVLITVETEAEEPAAEPVLVGYGASEPAVRRRPRKRPDVERRDHRTAATPPVRKLAKDLGLDLASVVPTGPNGVVTREDVQSAARSTEPEKGGRRIPVNGVRRAMARATTESAFTAPHVTEFLTVDVTRTMRLVGDLKSDPEYAGLRVTPLLLVAKALLVAIRPHPEINASWDEEGQAIVLHDAVNLGIAVATPRGLIVPNIKDAHARTLPELAQALQDLTETARSGRTQPGDLTGGTVTITNIGVFGVDAGTPILNPGEAAILAVGAIRLKPWVHKGEIKPRHVVTLALSFDHRLVDGELGSKVLARTGAVLEQPKRIIGWS
ncbi:Dihydrolipoyllysine-residue acetyltransferase component of pyruvate dehydrogenase complex [Actinomadura rubteroloni]|uniref:Dihydrolipoamide acetyltransferase component of pyruvate dehydrogenase complex n=1 Tax=Actinomadura rubteroloni TaxID=1926885 RepID=A0A2P4UMV2_9ACTN|nr:Dihydrolipoyllysine-residue acetyltransferase component of pyruvate dehydrogenase complex [Actinomadura rubteroloni]